MTQTRAMYHAVKFLLEQKVDINEIKFLSQYIILDDYTTRFIVNGETLSREPLKDRTVIVVSENDNTKNEKVSVQIAPLK
jgi:dihydrofolate reductase